MKFFNLCKKKGFCYAKIHEIPISLFLENIYAEPTNTDF